MTIRISTIVLGALSVALCASAMDTIKDAQGQKNNDLGKTLKIHLNTELEKQVQLESPTTPLQEITRTELIGSLKRIGSIPKNMLDDKIKFINKYENTEFEVLPVSNEIIESEDDDLKV